MKSRFQKITALLLSGGLFLSGVGGYAPAAVYADTSEVSTGILAGTATGESGAAAGAMPAESGTVAGTAVSESGAAAGATAAESGTVAGTAAGESGAAVGTVTGEAGTPAGTVITESEELPAGDLDLPEEVKLTAEEKRLLAEDDSVPTYTEPIPVLASTVPDVIRQCAGNYGYSKLSAAQQTFYKTLDSGMIDFLNSDRDLSSGNDYIAKFPYGSLSSKDAIRTFVAYNYDHPAYFWLYSYGLGNDSTLVVYAREEYLQDSKRDEMQQKIIDGLAGYKSAADSRGNRWEKVLAIHDKINANVKYAYKYGTTPETALWAHSVIGLFDNHKAVVCEGYAKAFSMIMNYLGIPAVYIVGDTESGAHAWNAVSLDENDGTYSYMDLTWDDGDLIDYKYFATPKSWFESEHKYWKSTSEGWSWLYDLPTLNTEMDQTYYVHYSCYAKASDVTNQVAAREFLNAATAAAPGTSLYLLVDNTTISRYIASELGVTSYAHAAYFGGKYRLYAAGGKPFDITSSKVERPATAFALSESSIALTSEVKSKDVTVTGITPENTDDYILLSTSNSRVASLSASYIHLTDPASGEAVFRVTAGKSGTATITAVSAKGGCSRTCTVTVTGGTISEHIFTDAQAQEAFDEAGIIYANGATKKDAATGVKTNYKSVTYYTDLSVPTYKVTSSKGKVSTKKGKLIVGITTTDTQPSVKNNKIVSEKAAKAIATVSLKKVTNGNSKITVTAKTPGEVYIWVMTLTAKDTVVDVGYAPVVVNQAPRKVQIQDKVFTDSTAAVVKTTTFDLGDSAIVYLKPHVVKSGQKENVSSCSFSPVIASSMQSFVKVTCLNEDAFQYRITAVGLKNSKKTTVSIKFLCDKSAASATIRFVIVNRVKSLALSKKSGDYTLTASGDSTAKINVSGDGTKKTFTFNEAVTLADDSAKTTDSVKVYALGSDTNVFEITSKGTVKVKTKPSTIQKKVTMKLVKNSTYDYQVTVAKSLKQSVDAYFLIFHNAEGTAQGQTWQIVKVSVTAA